MADETTIRDFSLVASQEANYQVGRMVLDVDKKGPWYNLTAIITLSPPDGGVTVTSIFSRDTNPTTFKFSGPTDGSGSVKFKLKTQTQGLYTVDVTGAGSSFVANSCSSLDIRLEDGANVSCTSSP